MFFNRLKVYLRNALIISTVLFVASFTKTNAQTNAVLPDKPETLNFYTIQKVKSNYWNTVDQTSRKGAWKQYRRWEYFWEQRVFPTGEFPNANMIFDEYKNSEKKYKPNEKTLGKVWSPLGPSTSPEAYTSSTREQGLGRVNAVRFHPTKPNEIWAGSAAGGVWRSNDNGKNWNVIPFTNFLSLGVSDIAISTSNPNVVYVATGDVDGTGSSADFYSIGIIKSTDYGTTWNVTGLSYEMSNRKLISRVLVDPTNENIVYAATNNGIYKSIDGGTTWNVSKSGVNIIDMEFKPNDPNTITAATFSRSGNGKIYQTENAGAAWTTALEYEGIVRFALAVTPANPNLVYALASESTNYGFGGLFFSTDGGKEWDLKFGSDGNPNLLGWYNGTGTDVGKGQGQYDLSLDISPIDENLIYLGGINIWRSTNGGTAWTLATHWFGGLGKPFVHADIHDIRFLPDGQSVISGHDGGIDRSTDKGYSWEFISDGMDITQFYKIGVAQTVSNNVIAGAQDNGTSHYTANGWFHVLSGDGMDCAIDPKNEKRMYGSQYNGSFHYSTDGGKSFESMINESITGHPGAWVTPIAIDPTNSNKVLVGFNDVWMSSNYGKWGSFTKISTFNSGQQLKFITVAPSNSNYIYASNYSTIYRTTNGGLNWKSIHNSSDGAITSIAVDYEDPAKIFFTKSGYSNGSKVYYYDGSKLSNLSGNLPNVPANTIVLQNDSPNRIYVGTDIGVFYSDYLSNVWEKYGEGMPNLIIMELEIQQNDKKLFAGSYGRGIWVADLLECNAPQPQIKVTGNTTFCKGDSVVIEVVGDYPAYKWTNGEITKGIVVKEQGDYSVTVDDGSGCSAKSQIVPVLVNNVPEMTISSDRTDFTTGNVIGLCEGDSVTFAANFGFNNYTWSNNETSRKITVKEAGDYSVSALTGDGCTSKSIVYTVTFSPAASKPTIEPLEGDSLRVITTASKIQWIVDNKEVAGATNTTFKPTKSGSQVVKVKVANGGDCWTMSDPQTIVSVEGEMFNESMIVVNPNPSKGMFTLKLNFKNVNEIKLTINNLAGEEIYSSNELNMGGELVKSIDITNQPAGVYFLTVNVGSQSFNKKLIKQ